MVSGSYIEMAYSQMGIVTLDGGGRGGGGGGGGWPENAERRRVGIYIHIYVFCKATTKVLVGAVLDATMDIPNLIAPGPVGVDGLGEFRAEFRASSWV